MWIELSRENDRIKQNKLLLNISNVKKIAQSIMDDNLIYVDELHIEFETAEDKEKGYLRLFEACYNESMVKI